MTVADNQPQVRCAERCDVQRHRYRILLKLYQASHSERETTSPSFYPVIEFVIASLCRFSHQLFAQFSGGHAKHVLKMSNEMRCIGEPAFESDFPYMSIRADEEPSAKPESNLTVELGWSVTGFGDKQPFKLPFTGTDKVCD